jgi:tol-pal system protein YbgF
MKIPVQKMMRSIGLLMLLGSGALMAQSQKDMILQLQRDMSLLQEQVKALQASQNERFTSLSTEFRVATELVQRLNATLAVQQASMTEKLNDITKNVSAPVAAVGSKVDSMADQFQSLSNSVADLNSRLGKVDAKIVELQKMVQAIQQPVAPPPGAAPTGGTGGTSVPPAEKIYNDAQRDFTAGNYDIALQGFQEYLRNYGTTQLAADAQYFIGEVYFRRDDFEGAVKEYDKVIDNYSDSSRVANARFMKGISLMKLTRRSEAKKEFLTIVEKFPGHELVPRSKDYLKVLGVNTSQAPSAATKKSPVRKR